MNNNNPQLCNHSVVYNSYLSLVFVSIPQIPSRHNLYQHSQSKIISLGTIVIPLLTDYIVLYIIIIVSETIRLLCSSCKSFSTCICVCMYVSLCGVCVYSCKTLCVWDALGQCPLVRPGTMFVCVFTVQFSCAHCPFAQTFTLCCQHQRPITLYSISSAIMYYRCIMKCHKFSVSNCCVHLCDECFVRSAIYHYSYIIIAIALLLAIKF